MDLKEIEELCQEFGRIKEDIYEKLEPNPGMPRVIMMGLTGSGKSSLMNCLSGREIRIVEGRGRRIELIGEGIQSGSESFTRRPEIYLDESSGIIYCDCPGFEDSGGIKQEILNSYAIDQLLQNINERQCLIKILFIISAYEIESGRSQIILRNIERIERILTNEDEMRSGVGIVITKGDEEITGIDYLERIKENANDKLRRWCDYYIEHQEHLFTFPKAPRSRIGEEYYDFPDRTRLNEFLQTHQIINPRHEVGLSENSLLHIELMKSYNSHFLLETVTLLFEKISTQYRNVNDIDNIEIYLYLLKKMNILQVNSTKSLQNIIKTFPMNNIYENDLKKLNEIELFLTFMDTIQNKKNMFNLYDVIQPFLIETIQELEHLHHQLQIIDNQKQKIEIQKQLSTEKDHLIEEQIKESKKENIKSVLIGAGVGALFLLS